MKLSIVIPVYYNKESLKPLYEDIRTKLVDSGVIDDYEIVMVDDGSGDESYQEMEQIRAKDRRVKIYKLSRNFGSHSAIMCGISKASGDCVVVKSADMQEPTEIIVEMLEKWSNGANVVLAVREERNEGKLKVAFANIYYRFVRRFILSSMPINGFDVYLIDKKVANVLKSLDERNSVLTAMLLWMGFRTEYVYYTRLARIHGKSRWTFKKKVRLFENSIYSFSDFPIRLVTSVGVVSFCVAAVWGIVVLLMRLKGGIDVTGWTTMFILNLLSFGIMMSTMGILGQYIWRIYDDTRKRPSYIIEEEEDEDDGE